MSLRTGPSEGAIVLHAFISKLTAISANVHVLLRESA